ncbi:hypothetical protein VN1204_09180 [Helicobacter pylori]|nr:hypothetical protein VN1204_09180 [Helicobacter pylori]
MGYKQSLAKISIIYRHLTKERLKSIHTKGHKMLLSYGFLEFENGKTENRTRDYSLTKAIDKELEAKRLAKRTRARVKVKEGLSLRATLDAVGEELS